MNVYRGSYGSNNTVCWIYEYKGWYAVEDSVNVNKAAESELYEGVDVELVEDYDFFTAGSPINSLKALVDAVNS